MLLCLTAEMKKPFLEDIVGKDPGVEARFL